MSYMTNLAFLFIEMLLSEVFLKSSLNLIVGAFCLKFTLSKLYILTKHSDYRFANLNMLFYFTLGDFNIASSAVNLNFVVKLHHYTVRLFHF